jgi:hypothetical protein
MLKLDLMRQNENFEKRLQWRLRKTQRLKVPGKQLHHKLSNLDVKSIGTVETQESDRSVLSDGSSFITMKKMGLKSKCFFVFYELILFS